MSDRLFESAFDGEPEPAAMTAAEAAELRALKALKADLVALRDVPECQLTTDHLRRAILDQGVRPVKPRLPMFGRWLWAAPVAAAMAVVLFLNRPKEIVPDARELASATPVRASAEPAAAVVVPEQDEPVTVASATQPAPSVVADSRPERPRRRPARRLTVDEGPLLAMREDASAVARPMAAEPVTRDEAQPSQPEAVVFTESSDPATGTAAAQEVTISTDVVFGG